MLILWRMSQPILISPECVLSSVMDVQSIMAQEGIENVHDVVPTKLEEHAGPWSLVLASAGDGKESRFVHAQK
jgi:hypothetical protein